MRVIFEMTVKLLANSADMFQPFIEANLVLGLLRNGNHDSANRSWRHDAPNRHHFSVSAAHHIIYYTSQRGLRHTRSSIGQAHDDLATIILAHSVQDTACNVRAHAVYHSHRNVGSSCYHLCFLEQTASQEITILGCLLSVVIRN